MCSNRIEITKDHNIPFIICPLYIHQYLLKHTFSPTIRIGKNTFRTILSNWNFYRISIYSSTTAEYDILATMFSHHPDQAKSSCNIVIVVLKRLFKTLTHSFKTSKVNTSRNLCSANTAHQEQVLSDINLIEGNLFDSYNLRYSLK